MEAHATNAWHHARSGASDGARRRPQRKGRTEPLLQARDTELEACVEARVARGAEEVGLLRPRSNGGLVSE